MLSNLAVVDTETTGLRPSRDRVIEIGMVLVNEGKVIEEWQSLVNPERSISPMITQITGISPEELWEAPTFIELAEEILQRLEGRVLVAHNARFDYGFLRQEFQRIGVELHQPQLCTVRLSRKLFPKVKGHSLDAVIKRFGLRVERRHRALADAGATWQFLSQSYQDRPQEVESQVEQIVQKPALPPQISSQMIDALPNSFGVYCFYDADGVPLYIGKSIHVKQRVREHFYADLTSRKEMALKQQVADIEVQETAGELSALLLESKLVKKMQPIHNRKLKRQHELCLVLTDGGMDEYQQVKLVRETEVKIQAVMEAWGVGRSLRQLKGALRKLAVEHELCLRVLGLENGKKACFNYHLGDCRGACMGKEPVDEFNHRLSRALEKLKVMRWPYSGPIAVRERNEESGMEAVHVFHHWSHLGSAQDWDELHGITAELKAQSFNLDVYQILRQYLPTYHQHGLVQLL